MQNLWDNKEKRTRVIRMGAANQLWINNRNEDRSVRLIKVS